jgi:hypothetical protein
VLARRQDLFDAALTRRGPMTSPYRVSWREWGGILATCTMSGTAIGTAALWMRMPRLPWAIVPLAALGAFAVAATFALIASVLAAVALLFAAPHSAISASRLRLAVSGAIAGAAAGTVHPFVIVVAIVRALSMQSGAWTVLPLTGLVAASGAAAGAIIFPRYLPFIRARGGAPR